MALVVPELTGEKPMAKLTGLFMRGAVNGSKGSAGRMGSRLRGISTFVVCETVRSDTQLTYNAQEDCYDVVVTISKNTINPSYYSNAPGNIIKTFTYKTNED